MDSEKTIDIITKDTYLVFDVSPGRHVISAEWNNPLSKKSHYQDKVNVYVTKGKTLYLHFFIDNYAGAPILVAEKPDDPAMYSSRKALVITYPKDQ
jgi:hypothetical protein